MNFSSPKPAHEFLQVRIFRTCQILCDILDSERQFITRFELTSMHALERKKVSCINDLEYLMSRVEASLPPGNIPGDASNRYGCNLNDFARTKSALYLQMGSVALQNQIEQMVLGTQSLITSALHQISNTRSKLHSTGGPMDRNQAQDPTSDLLGASNYLDIQETNLEQIYASNQRLLVLIKALQSLTTGKSISESQ